MGRTWNIQTPISPNWRIFSCSSHGLQGALASSNQPPTAASRTGNHACHGHEIGNALTSSSKLRRLRDDTLRDARSAFFEALRRLLLVERLRRLYSLLFLSVLSFAHIAPLLPINPRRSPSCGCEIPGRISSCRRGSPDVHSAELVRRCKWTPRGGSLAHIPYCVRIAIGMRSPVC
jgi:hypothetical protein